jgi:hypothetical protein
MPLRLLGGFEKRTLSVLVWKSLLFWIDWLQWAPAGLSCALYLQGKRSGAELLLLSCCVPVVRFLVAPTFRRRVLDRLHTLRDSLEAYPLRSKRPPWSGVFVWVVLPVGLFLLFRDYAIVSGDSRPAVLTASSIVSEGRCELSKVALVYAKFGLFTADEQMPYFCRRTDTGIHSSYPLGMVPFVLPVAAAAHLLGADLDHPHVHDRVEKWTSAWLAALSLGLFFLLVLHLAPLIPAWMTTLILAVGSVMFTTVGQALWQHGGVIFWSLLALLVEFRCHGRPRLTGTIVQGVTFGMMLACRLSSVVFIVPFAVWVLLRSPARALALGLCTGLAFAPWACLHASIYGTILGPSTGQLAAGNWSGISASSLAAVLISPGRGMLVYQPWILLAVINLLPSLPGKTTLGERAVCPAGWAWFCVWVILLQLALISSWRCWWGGYCWGSRLAAEAVPLLALLCVRPIALLWHTGTGKGLVLSLALLSCFMHVPAIYLRSADWNGRVNADHHAEKIWSWSDPPFLYPLLH